ncbi:MAG TPA: YetF domain-containing protein [Tepidisphaeraceae bacterium]|jgi:uncharacterized membrane protein YcaP (DUF421 family)
MWQLQTVKWWEFIIRASVVYLSVFALLRVGGKRQVGQMGTGQLVALLLISNAVQNAMNGNDGSLTGGLILASVLIFWSFLFEVLTARFKRLEDLIQGRPTTLIRHGKVLHRALRHEQVSLSELRAGLRKHGIQRLESIEEAILEIDGSISVRKQGEPENLGWGERNDVY